MSDDKPYEFGLEITRVTKGHAFPRELAVQVRVVRRATEEHDIKSGYLHLGLTSAYQWGYGKRLQGLEFNELEVRGHIYESRDDGRRLIGYDPRYFNPYSVELCEAERYVKTLRRFSALREKWKNANPTLEVTPAVNFLLFAKLTEAKFAFWRDYSDQTKPWRKHSEDEYLSIPQAARKYVEEIEHLKEVWVDPWKPRQVA